MEDFVPYELAVKLKEKGFREKVNAYYGKHENIFDIHPALDMNDADYRASAPTISQVLKWLREEKKIHIAITITQDNNERFGGWDCIIVDFSSKNHRHIFDVCRYKNENRSYELASLAGINYVIDNLI